MQRFLPVGQSRVQVLSGMQHDVQDARRVAAAIEQMRPATLVVDRAAVQWQTIGEPNDLQRVVLETLGGVPDALWALAHKAARQAGTRVVLLHQDAPDPPKKGIKQLRRLLKREGFERTADGRRDLQRLHAHYLARTELWPWVEAHRDRSAARLRAALETSPTRAVALLPFPDADIVCDRVQALGRDGQGKTGRHPTRRDEGGHGQSRT